MSAEVTCNGANGTRIAAEDATQILISANAASATVTISIKVPGVVTAKRYVPNDTTSITASVISNSKTYGAVHGASTGTLGIVNDVVITDVTVTSMTENITSYRVTGSFSATLARSGAGDGVTLTTTF